MRTSYTVHHTLTTEAATIVKQAISLARRRGHAQVTPLHVASAMLGSSTGLLRGACLQSHSHPLQCKALELCFNVSLNRLPTSGSSPILAPHSHHHPSFSNALVAAFKRAQAHQRRGSVESQQQPILALKVELEQLVISILDDPSVSRVMREAGFSSPQVKANVEQAVSLEICSQSPPTTSLSRQSEGIRKSSSVLISNNVSLFHSMNEFRATPNDEKVQSQDVMSVLDSLMSKKKRNIAIVGECLASAEGVVRGVIDKFNRGEVQGDMKCVQFISLPIFPLRSLPVEEVEQKVGELRCLVKSCVSRGVVLYLGDLKWVSEFWSNHGQNYYHCPAVKLMIMELSRLLLGGIGGENGKLWVVGIATFHTYMRCKTGQPSLETLWQLHPLTVPVGSLGLSLNLESDWKGSHEFQSKTPGEESSWSQIKIGVEKNLTCCTECLANFNREAQSTAMNTYNSNYNESVTTSTASSNLPSWLQQYKEENKRKTNNDQELNKLGELCKKWNSICSSVHKQPHFLEKTLKFSSPSPSSSTSISSSHDLNQTLLNWPVIFEPKGSPKEHQFLISESDPKVPDLLSNPNSSPNSASSSETNDHDDIECLHWFKEVNSDNLKALCNAMERKVPWQRDVIPDIANTILQCRSGMVGRKDGKEETWMFFLGIDFEGKKKIAKELAKVVFGSRSYFVTIGLNNFFSSATTRADSSEELSKKRARDELGSSYLERFADAVRENPSRVFFMEDLEQVDFCSQKGIKRAIESGRITLAGGGGGDQAVPLKDAIVIFSCDSVSSMSRACSPPIRRKCGDRREEKEDKDESEEIIECGSSLDLNVASAEDGNGDHEHSVDHNVAAGSVLDSVDRQIFFKVQVL